MSRQPGVSSTLSLGSVDKISTLVSPKLWTLLHCQGMTSPVPSPQCSQISLSYHSPGSHGCFRAVAFYSHVTLGARTSLKTACGSNCRAAPHSLFHLLAPLWEPRPISFCSWTHRTMFSTHSLLPCREIHFPSSCKLSHFACT